MTVVAQEIAPIILLADADILSRHAIADYLRASGHSVIEVVNFQETRIVIERFTQRIKLVLCDVTTLAENDIPELIRCADRNQLLSSLTFAAGFEAVARAAIALSNSGDMSKDKQDFELLVSYIFYTKAKLSYRMSH